MTINDKNVDGVLGSRTQGCRMESTDESTELWRHPQIGCMLTIDLLQIAWTDRFEYVAFNLGKTRTVLIKSEASRMTKIHNWHVLLSVN